jgi:hypothetical protein
MCGAETKRFKLHINVENPEKTHHYFCSRACLEQWCYDVQGLVEEMTSVEKDVRT